MNSLSLLFFLLHLCCFMETLSSAKLHNGTKLQAKDEKMTKKSGSASRDANDKTRNSRRTFLFKKQKWPQPLGDNFLKRVRKITKGPTTSTHCKIFCRSGYHLQILPNGVVKGTVDQESKYGKSRKPSSRRKIKARNRNKITSTAATRVTYSQ